MLCSISSSLLHQTAFSTFSAKYDIILEDFPSIVKSMVSLDQNITEEMKARDQMTWIGAHLRRRVGNPNHLQAG